MKVSEILKKNEVTISCEIFPPKQGAQLQNYKAIAAEIAKLKPAYISCTYGATGGTSDYTVEIADAGNRTSDLRLFHKRKGTYCNP